MPICPHPAPLSDAPRTIRHDWMRLHFAGVRETLDRTDRQHPYDESTHKAQMYANRYKIEAALHEADGQCPACCRAVLRLYADFDHTHTVFRGVLCRRCREKTRKVLVDHDGRITWAANSAWCAIVADYLDHSCQIYWQHPHRYDSGLCEEDGGASCAADSRIWLGLARHLAVSEGTEGGYTPLCLPQEPVPLAQPAPPVQIISRRPTTAREVETVVPVSTPLFLAPAHRAD